MDGLLTRPQVLRPASARAAIKSAAECLLRAVAATGLCAAAAAAQADAAAPDVTAERRAAYESAYRECGSDSLRALVREGAAASDVAREHVRRSISSAGEAVRAPGEPGRDWNRVFAGCLAVLSGEPSQYDTAVAPRAGLAAPRARPRERQSMLGSYAWVFYFDVLFGVVAFAAAAAFHHREDAGAVRNMWVIASALLGAFAGALAFLGVGVLAAITMIMSTPSELMLAAMTGLTIAFAAVGIAAAPRRRRRW